MAVESFILEVYEILEEKRFILKYSILGLEKREYC